MAKKVTIAEVEAGYLKKNIPEFRSGDVVKVHTKVKEGSRERIQIFEGMVMQRKNAGLRATFTVRKVSFGIGVERIFPLHSPSIEKIELVKTGKVRRTRLYYMRSLTSKESRLKERDIRKVAVAAAAVPVTGAAEPAAE